MNHNSRGRLTGMPGTETTVTLHPQRLGVRTRNSIIRMIENRTLQGGWQSKSKRIAQELSKQYGLQCGSTNGNGLRILGLSVEAAPSVAEVLRADWTARLLEAPPSRNGYYEDQYKEAMVCINNLNSNFYVNMHDKDAISKVIEILAEHTTQEMKDKSKAIVDLLKGTEPIHLITFKE
jgi:hypothetical protein